MNNPPAATQERAQPQAEATSQQPMQEAPQQSGVPISKPKNNKWLMMVFVGVILVLVGIGSYFGYSYFQLKKQASPSTSPTPTADSTAGWETYADSGYQFKYPSNYVLTKDERGNTFLNQKISWGFRPDSLIDCRGDCYVVTLTEDVMVDDIKSKKISGWIGDIFGIPQSFISYEIPYNGQYFSFFLWELPQNLSTDDFLDENGVYTGREVGKIDETDIEVFDQILSTFEFVKQYSGEEAEIKELAEKYAAAYSAGDWDTLKTYLTKSAQEDIEENIISLGTGYKFEKYEILSISRDFETGNYRVTIRFYLNGQPYKSLFGDPQIRFTKEEGEWKSLTWYLYQ